MVTHELICFGTRPGQGNAAIVIEHGPADPAGRQAIARERGVSACVFLSGDAQVQADFYYPHARSPMCVHASLAAAHVLLSRQAGTAPLHIVTAMRGQRVTLLRRDGATYAGLQRQAVAPLGVTPALAAWLLGAPDLALASAPLLASVGSPKLLIEVAGVQALHALRPPLDRIVDWGKEHGVNGCYAYCRTGEHEYEGRNFNHLDPAREDSATGVAAGALSVWLGRGLTVDQGGLLGNPCKIITRIENDTVFIGGMTALATR